MPFELHWNVRSHRVISRFAGAISMADVMQSDVELQSDKRFSDLREVVVDLCAIDKMPNDEVLAFLVGSQYRKAFSNPQCYVAMLCPNRGVATHLRPHMMEHSSIRHRVTVLPDWVQVNSWLEFSREDSRVRAFA